MKVRVRVRTTASGSDWTTAIVDVPDEVVAGLSDEDRRLVIEDFVRSKVIEMVDWEWEENGNGNGKRGSVASA